MRLNYIGNTTTDSIVDIDDIEATVKNLKRQGSWCCWSYSVWAYYIQSPLYCCAFEDFITYDAFTWCFLHELFFLHLFLFEFIYAMLPHCTFCHRCSLWLYRVARHPLEDMLLTEPEPEPEPEPEHGYVPDSFGSGIVVPLVKDKCGDVIRR